MTGISGFLKKINLPLKSSHKGQNGRVMIIGGSKLFHSASIWALEVASRLVDLVHYASIEENNNIISEMKKNFRNGIVIPRSEIENYIEEDDVILIGPGMVRMQNAKCKNQNAKLQFKMKNLREILDINHEGEQTYWLTKYLLNKYPAKKWVIDAGALQMMDLNDIPRNSILTPHRKEFIQLLDKFSIFNFQFSMNDKMIKFSNSDYIKYLKIISIKTRSTIILKGESDYIASEKKFMEVKGGNAGMTKGGTGDVLAGLVAGLYAKNDAFISAVSASYINKRAGDDLYRKKGYWFNASDLANQIPETMRKLVI